MIKVIREVRNHLLKRKEFNVVVKSYSNPGYEKIRTDISKNLGIEADKIIIKKLVNKFGSDNFSVDLFVYDSDEDQKKIEVRNRRKKVKK